MKTSDIREYVKQHIGKWIGCKKPGPLPVQEVKGITLLSREEYLEAKNIIPLLDDTWWLRSPGYLSYDAAYVRSDGGVDDLGNRVGDSAVSVRPALRLNPESDNLQIGEKVRIAGHTWTVIHGGLALCDEFIGMHCFRKDWDAPDAGDYEESDVERYIEGWAREHGLLPEELAPSDVTGITLLSKEEYDAARDIVPLLDGWWWLRSPGDYSSSAALVLYVGGVRVDGGIVDVRAVPVRPALQLNPESRNFSISDRFLAAGHTWTVIPGNLALCDGSIGGKCFREDWIAPDANIYEVSDINRFIENWARENGLLPKEICARDVTGAGAISSA